METFKVKNNKIILPKLKKGTEVRVYFSREPKTETTYPVCTTTIDQTNELSWFEGYDILRIEARKPKLFGIFKSKWFVIE